MKSGICIESNLKDLKEGDHLFSADFVSDSGGDRLEVKEFEFVKYLVNENHSEIEINVNSIPAEIFDIRYPKIMSKVDISYGFFLSDKEAVLEFFNMIQHIYKVVKKSYKNYVNLSVNEDNKTS